MRAGTLKDLLQAGDRVAVSNITDATQVAANTGFACALLTSRKVECWGDNWYGQLGNGTAGGEWWIPVTVVGIP